MTPRRRQHLLSSSRLGRLVSTGSELPPDQSPPPALFATPPAGRQGDLDPEGHWVTISGNNIHITQDGEIDAGGHPALRQVLAEKAGLKAKPDDPAAARARAAVVWERVAGHGRVYSLPADLVPPGGVKWQVVEHDIKHGPAAAYGTARYVGRLADGSEAGYAISTGYDNHVESYLVHQPVLDRVVADNAIAAGRTIDESRGLAATGSGYRQDAAKQLVAAYDRMTPERQAEFRRLSGSVARVMAAAPAEQFSEAARHFRETGRAIKRDRLPVAARAGFDGAAKQLDADLEATVGDRATRKLVAATPGYEAARESAVWGEPAAWRQFLATALPPATAAARAAREAKQTEFRAWAAANERPLAAELGRGVPAALVPAALRWVEDRVTGDDPASDWQAVDGWGEHLRSRLLDDAVPADRHPELAAHGAGLRAEADRRREAERVANRPVRVTGNTFPLKDTIKAIPGARFRGGAWWIPVQHVGKLPRKLGYRDE